MSDHPATGKLAECLLCGYQWEYGKHGGHSCIDELKKRVSMLEHRFAKLFAVSNEVSVEGYSQSIIERDIENNCVAIMNADGRDITKCSDPEKTAIEQFITAADLLPEPRKPMETTDG